MQNQKPLEFHGGAGGYFVLTILSVLIYIPFFGWAFYLNYASGWFADNTLVNGKGIRYQAGYGESLKFVFLNYLLVLVTLGIYSFWFIPKMYRYVVNHTDYLDAAPVAPAPSPTAPTPITPSAPVTPPTPPSLVQ